MTAYEKAEPLLCLQNLTSQSYGLSSSHVWMWQLDHKKVECQRIDAFELWCWRRLLRVPWTAGRSKVHLKGNQSWLFIGRTDANLTLQYFGHLLWRVDTFEKTLMLGKIEGGRSKGHQRMRLLDKSPTLLTWLWGGSGSWWWTGRPGVLQSMGLPRVGHNWVTELKWTELNVLTTVQLLFIYVGFLFLGF